MCEFFSYIPLYRLKSRKIKNVLGFEGGGYEAKVRKVLPIKKPHASFGMGFNHNDLK